MIPRGGAGDISVYKPPAVGKVDFRCAAHCVSQNPDCVYPILIFQNHQAVRVLKVPLYAGAGISNVIYKNTDCIPTPPSTAKRTILHIIHCFHCRLTGWLQSHLDFITAKERNDGYNTVYYTYHVTVYLLICSVVNSFKRLVNLYQTLADRCFILLQPPYSNILWGQDDHNRGCSIRGLEWIQPLNCTNINAIWWAIKYRDNLYNLTQDHTLDTWFVIVIP